MQNLRRTSNIQFLMLTNYSVLNEHQLQELTHIFRSI